MDDNDPITQFFPGEEDIDLYNVLSLEVNATLEAIKKAYRRLALLYHPDKHATSTGQVREDASTKFQQIGFAYAVLGDPKRKARYDVTGKTDEGLDLEPGEGGWDAYFEDLFDRVTRGKLDEMKKEYQGSSEEIEDLKTAYHNTNGSLGELMSFIPHSTHDDESRFITIISDLIEKGELLATPTWLSSSKDEKAKLGRRKQGEKEAKEAEMAAKELGVWDEFYGSGKKTERKEKGKRKDDAGAEANEDHSALQALIMRKKEKNMDAFFDDLAAKYSDPTTKDNSRRKGKKRGHDTGDDNKSSKKSRPNVPPAPEIDDEEFAKLQEKLFGATTPSASESIKGKGKRAK